jgi:hypothetical protein
VAARQLIGHDAAGGAISICGSGLAGTAPAAAALIYDLLATLASS